MDSTLIFKDAHVVSDRRVRQVCQWFLPVHSLWRRQRHLRSRRTRCWEDTAHPPVTTPGHPAGTPNQHLCYWSGSEETPHLQMQITDRKHIKYVKSGFKNLWDNLRWTEINRRCIFCSFCCCFHRYFVSFCWKDSSLTACWDHSVVVLFSDFSAHITSCVHGA